MIEWIAPPVIGAVIGYCTNYIAVKMLFRPYKPVKIGKWTVPFTPGVMPKRQPALAKAMGKAVGNSLLGENEILKMLKSDNIKEKVSEGIIDAVRAFLEKKSVKMLAEKLAGEDSYTKAKEKTELYISEKIRDSIKEIDIQSVVIEKGKEAVLQMGGMIAMFVNDAMIAAIAQPIGAGIESYIATEGMEKIQKAVSEEINLLEMKEPGTMIPEDVWTRMEKEIAITYDSFVDQKGKAIAESFDVCSVVEEKINAMDVRELENLVMSVMKHELGMVVNLGAVIGFVLGLLNLLF